MLSCNRMTIDGKNVRKLYLDGKLAYVGTDKMDDVNNYAWSILSSALSVGSGYYNYPSTTTRYDYNIYSTFDEGGYTGSGAGNVRPFVVSQHILATA